MSTDLRFLTKVGNAIGVARLNWGMRVDCATGTIVDGEHVYEFHPNTDLHFDVLLDGQVVAELGYLPGRLLPDVAQPRLAEDVIERLAILWGQHLRKTAQI